MVIYKNYFLEGLITPEQMNPKYAASSMDSKEQLKYLATENPSFSGSGELSPAQRGTLLHRFMEICDLTRISDDLLGEIRKAVENNIFTEKEADALNVSALEKFISSDLYERIIIPFF